MELYSPTLGLDAEHGEVCAFALAGIVKTSVQPDEGGQDPRSGGGRRGIRCFCDVGTGIEEGMRVRIACVWYEVTRVSVWPGHMEVLAQERGERTG